jgi:hypothetical protein
MTTFMIGSSSTLPALLTASLQREAPGLLERDLARVDIVVLAVDERRP